MAYEFDQPRIEQLSHRWKNMQITRLQHEQQYEAAMIVAHKYVYEDLQRATGVPWYVIGVIDSREGGIHELCTRHLHNGDSLRWFTRQVPHGRPHVNHPPPFTFRESAIDALHLEGIADKPTDWWCIERILHVLEPYNGLGYWQVNNPHRLSTGGHPSPYIWSCTTIYDPPHGPGGKYDRDHHYNPSLVDPQVGCAPLLHAIAAADPSVSLWSMLDPAPVAAPSIIPASAVIGKVEANAIVLPRHMKRYGKKPAKPRPLLARFADLFHVQKLVDSTPPVFMHVTNDTVVNWYGNQHYGCCVFATKAHLIELRARAAGNPIPRFTDDSVLADYSRVTGFTMLDPSTDQGTDMGAAAEYWRTHGIIDADSGVHKAEFAVQIQRGNLVEMKLAAYWFGGMEFGCNVPKSAEEQFDAHQVWTPVAGSPDQGGHDTALVGFNSAGNFVIETWNALQAVSIPWVDAYMDEGEAVFSLEYLDKVGMSPEHYDKTTLMARAQSLHS